MKSFPTVYDTPYFDDICGRENNLKILIITSTSSEPEYLAPSSSVFWRLEAVPNVFLGLDVGLVIHWMGSDSFF